MIIKKNVKLKMLRMRVTLRTIMWWRYKDNFIIIKNVISN